MYYQKMSNFKNDLGNILEILQNIEIDLNLVGYSETEKKIYYTIALRLSKSGSCNITNLIETSGYSRSTIYKTIKKFELDNLIKLKQSHIDKREFNLLLPVS